MIEDLFTSKVMLKSSDNEFPYSGITVNRFGDGAGLMNMGIDIFEGKKYKITLLDPLKVLL